MPVNTATKTFCARHALCRRTQNINAACTAHAHMARGLALTCPITHSMPSRQAGHAAAVFRRVLGAHAEWQHQGSREKLHTLHAALIVFMHRHPPTRHLARPLPSPVMSGWTTILTRTTTRHRQAAVKSDCQRKCAVLTLHASLSRAVMVGGAASHFEGKSLCLGVALQGGMVGGGVACGSSPMRRSTRCSRFAVLCIIGMSWGHAATSDV